MDEAERKELGRRMAPGRAAKKQAAISALLVSGRAKTDAEAEAILKAERKSAKAASAAVAPEAQAPAHVFAEPVPGTAIPNVAVTRTFANFSSRNSGVLTVDNKTPGRHPRWVRKDQVQRRRSMGYNVVGSDSPLKTYIGDMSSGATGARETHDLVLMETSQANADAISKASVDKAASRRRALKSNAIEAAKRAGSAAGGSASIFGDITHVTNNRES